MKKLMGIILFMLAVQFTSLAQETPIRRNTIYIEYAGQGIFNSLSFDRLYRIDKKIKTSFTAGVTLVPLYKKMNMLVAAVPVSYNWLFGKKSHHLELGTGLTYYTLSTKVQFSDVALINETDSYLYFTPKIGYRFQKSNGGFFFRFTLTPTIGLIDYNGALKHNGKIYSQSRHTYAPYAGGPLEEWPIFPWGGFSFGYTIK